MHLCMHIHEHDVVCSYYCYRKCGTETIRRFILWAKKQGAKALRMYGTTASLAVWKLNWGFREAETILDKKGNIKYGPPMSVVD